VRDAKIRSLVRRRSAVRNEASAPMLHCIHTSHGVQTGWRRWGPFIPPGVDRVRLVTGLAGLVATSIVNRLLRCANAQTKPLQGPRADVDRGKSRTPLSGEEFSLRFTYSPYLTLRGLFLDRYVRLFFFFARNSYHRGVGDAYP
jgi:hypothetical protein